MRRNLFSVLLIAVLLTSFLFQLAYAYDNNKYGFSITPPTGWKVEEQTGSIAVIFTDTSPYTGASINVAVEETRGTLSAYVAGSKLQLASTLSNYTLVQEGSRVIGGLDCYAIISTWTPQSGMNVKMQQVFFVELGKAFVVTCAALESQYVNSLLNFENSLATFTITGVSQQATTPYNNTLIIVAVVVAAVVIAIVALFLLRKKSHVSEPPPQTTPISPSPNILPTNLGGDTAARLENLQNLLNRNIITKEEYEKRRGEILAQV